MQPMFGAPIGTMAAQTQASQNLNQSLAALQKIGELEQVPGQIAYREALAGQANAARAKDQAELNDQRLLTQYEQLAHQTAAAEGRDADITDVNAARDGTLKPLQRLYDVMTQRGAPSRLLVPLAKKISEIASSEGVAAYRNQQALKLATEGDEEVNTRVGSLAQAGIDSPQGYAMARLLATQAGLPPELRQLFDALPQDWEKGKELLRPLVVQSLKLKDAVELKQKEAKLQSDLKTAASSQARNQASAKVAQARLGLVTEQTNVLKKLGGEGSPVSQAAQEALTEQRRLTNEAKQLALYPRAPVDPSKRKPGVFYTLPNGRVGRIVVLPDGGQAVELKPETKPPRTAEEIRKEQLRRARLSGLDTDALDEEGE